MQFMRSGDVAIHYRAQGIEAGKPVIAFINSLGTDFRMWEPVMAELGDAYGYLLHDKRGHGLSDLGATPYAIADHVADLVALMDHVTVGKAIVWGLSVGGLVAQGLYATRPEMVRALVLSNTADRIGTADIWKERIEKVLSEGVGSMVEPVMERWFTPAFRQPDNALYRGARNMLARQSAQGYAATCAAIRDADFTQQTARIAVPTLCVAGDSDGSTPADLVKSVAAKIAGSRFALIEACGHIPCLQQPRIYAGIVRDFLNSVQEP